MGFLGGFFWVGFLGGFFIANPTTKKGALPREHERARARDLRAVGRAAARPPGLDCGNKVQDLRVFLNF